jgi:hypothetical protein
MKMMNLLPQVPTSESLETDPKDSALWEYVVDDFLEMACSLTPEKRHLLLTELRLQDPTSDSIDTHPSFSLNGRLVIVVEGTKIEECWLFYPGEKRIEKYPLKKRRP